MQIQIFAFTLVSFVILHYLCSMYFSDYRRHKGEQIRPSLLWEYDMQKFDFQKMRSVVVQRVIERGLPSDYYAMFSLYGIRGVRESVKELPYLNPKDMSFVCALLNLKKEDLRCYTRKQSRPQHWNS